MMRRSISLIALAGALVVMSPAAAQQMSNRCVTPQFWCQLSNFGPVGSPCYCNTPYGPVPGILR